MTQIKLHCCKCNEDIIITENDFCASKEIVCPTCNAKLPLRFNDDLYHALGLLSDINRELDKDNREINTDKFEVSIEFIKD